MTQFRIIVKYTDTDKSVSRPFPIVKVFKSWDEKAAKDRLNHLKSMLKENGYKLLEVELLKVEPIEF